MITAAKFGRAFSGLACASLLACSRSAGIHPRAASGPTACDLRPLKIDDVNGILTAPITNVKPVSGDAQSCEFLTAGFPEITVSVRPGLGRTTVEAWLARKMPLKASRLAGVGDAAVWQDTLHDLIAQKDGALCEIQVRGSALDIAVESQGLPMAVGALCNKVFAAP